MKPQNTGIQIIPSVGDWICAYHNGLLAIAEVKYIAWSTDPEHIGAALYVTTMGAVRMDDILEVRRPM